MSEREKIDWEQYRVNRWAAGHYVALSPCLVPIIADPSRRRARERAIALGCTTPAVVPGSHIRMRVEDMENLCSCHDQFGHRKEP